MRLHPSPSPRLFLCSCSNIKPLLAIDLPTCFGHEEPRSCSKSAADSVTYVEVNPGGLLSLQGAGDALQCAGAASAS